MFTFVSTFPVCLSPTALSVGLCSFRPRRLRALQAPHVRHPAHISCQQTNPANDNEDTTLPEGEELVYSAMLGDTAAVVDMLSNGVPAGYASTKGNSGMTALMWAAAEGNAQIAEQLISAGADINATNGQGATALLFAVENLPSANPREAPLAGYPGRPGKQPKQTPIVRRVTGHASIVKQLLTLGADIHIRSTADETLLHMVSRKAQDRLVRELLGRGLDINGRSVGYQETPLHVAAKESHTETVKLLCDLGANIEAQSRFGWTPLVWAAAHGWIDAARELIDRGANVNVKAGEGTHATTALKEARRCVNAETMSKMLIRAGAIE